MADAGAAARPEKRLGTVGALGAIALITIVTLLVMGVVLTQDPAPDTGRRTSSKSDDAAAAPGTAGTSSTTTTAKPKPGLTRPLPDLDDGSGWATDLTVGNGVTCIGPTLLGNIAGVFCDNRHMYGFDATTGEQLWDTKPDDDHQTFINPPFAAGTNVFAYARADIVTGLDATTGEVLWRNTRPGIILGIVTTETHVVVVAAGHATALDPTTGAVQWDTSFVDGIFTTGGVRLDATAKHLVVNVGTGFQSLDITTGAIEWTATVDVPDVNALRTADDAIYAMSTTGAVTTLDPADGHIRWQRKGLFDHNQQTIAGWDGDTLYLSSTNMIGALSRADGATVWTITSSDLLQQADAIDRSTFEGGHLISRGQGQVWDIDPKTGVFKAGKNLNSATPGRVRGKELFILQATFAPNAPWRLLTLAL